MARRPSVPLTDAEARLMAVLWKKQSATVAEVVAGVGAEHSVAYSTVQTLLRILESKGYVAHEKVGRAFLYQPLVDARQARVRALRHLAARLFEGSPSLLVLNVLQDERIDSVELERLKKLIAEA